jgi:hypothetical protein
MVPRILSDLALVSMVVCAIQQILCGSLGVSFACFSLVSAFLVQSLYKERGLQIIAQREQDRRDLELMLRNQLVLRRRDRFLKDLRVCAACAA